MGFLFSVIWAHAGFKAGNLALKNLAGCQIVEPLQIFFSHVGSAPITKQITVCSV
ncbi:hypothetical protein predicted by Glimmer/Critica [Corynebacterium glutamicum ATCC 13032]|nr:hypothetical protein predicted by Glimmer/Critica [Corynebacterium glutamicum ATCC 13032]